MKIIITCIPIDNMKINEIYHSTDTRRRMFHVNMNSISIKRSSEILYNIIHVKFYGIRGVKSPGILGGHI